MHQETCCHHLPRLAAPAAWPRRVVSVEHPAACPLWLLNVEHPAACPVTRLSREGSAVPLALMLKEELQRGGAAQSSSSDERLLQRMHLIPVSHPARQLVTWCAPHCSLVASSVAVAWLRWVDPALSPRGGASSDHSARSGTIWPCPCGPIAVKYSMLTRLGSCQAMSVACHGLRRHGLCGE